jgi:predicted nucleotidyltransferase component of viral defense system
MLHLRPREMRAALESTAATTGFAPHFLEKDYWCSLLLQALYRDDTPLVFKGGTLLSKAFTGFHRLSEDLDFTLPTESDTPRSLRGRRAREVGARWNAIATDLRLTWADPWTGHNNSRQYTGRVGYPSVLGLSESVLIEVGQREPIITQVESTELHTLLQDALFQEPVLPPFTARTLSPEEAYAEKVRAALTRETPAIRDLYDLWQAHQLALLPMQDPAWLALIAHKCAGVDLTMALSTERERAFEAGIKSALQPMLRTPAKPFTLSPELSLLADLRDRVLNI